MPAKVFSQEDLLRNKLLPHKVEALWSGTGFLTADKKLITGRHVIQPWRFQLESSKVIKWLGLLESDNIIISVQFSAENSSSPDKNFLFKTEDVVLPASTDSKESVSIKSNPIGGVKLSSNSLQVNKASDPVSDIASIPAPFAGQARPGDISEVATQTRIVVFSHQFQLTEKPASKGLLARSDKNYVQQVQNLTLVKSDYRSKMAGKSKQCLTLDKSPQLTGATTGGPAFALIGNQAYFVGIVPTGHSCITPILRL